jgi:ABC-type nitrate/sulfonate/bicarbonate transport system substrate-binding protein
MDAIIARGSGTFNKAGLTPAWTNVATASGTLAALTSCEADIVYLTPSTPIVAAASGRPVNLFACGTRRVTTFVYISKATADKLATRGVTPQSPIADRIKALKGLTIGSQSSGGPTEIFLRIALQSVGLSPNTDVKYQSGTSDALAAAFKAGQIVANASAPPSPFLAQFDGTGVIWVSGPGGDVPEWNKGYSLCWATTPAFAKAHGDVLKRLINGLKMTSDLIAKDREASLGVLRTVFPSLDSQVLAAIFDAMRSAYVTDPNIKTSLMQETINFYNASAANKVNLTPKDLVPDGFLASQ